MNVNYYEPCEELDRSNEIIELYYKKGDYETCFKEYMKVAKTGYPLAECQVGWFYLKGLGVEIDNEKAFYWTKKSAEHGDHDAQNNLGEFYEEGIGTAIDLDKAFYWYKVSAKNGSPEGLQRCKELNIL